MRCLHIALAVMSLAAANTVSPVAAQAISDDDWTVLTMAPDGSWGAATGPINQAIANAIAKCKVAYQREIGCGAVLTSIRTGWSLGVQCGGETIVVAEKTLADAEQAATRREAKLRQHYVPNIPPCRRVVTVDPNGSIIMPAEGGATSRVSGR